MIITKKIINKKRQQGLSLLESILALIIASTFIVLLIQQTVSGSISIRNQSVASQVQELYLASQQYLNTYSYDLTQGTSVGGGALIIPVGKTSANGTVPTGPTVVVSGTSVTLSSFQGGGYMPSNYINTNAYGQNYELLVRQPQTGVIEGLLVSTGGLNIVDSSLGEITTKIGAYGGFEAAKNTGSTSGCPAGSNTAGCITGAFGGWETTSSTWGNVPQSGHIMATLIFNNGSQITDYLYRDNIGNSVANTMNTDINMSGNNLNSVNNLNVNTINSANGSGIVTLNNNVLQVTDSSAPYALEVTGNEYASGNDAVGGNVTVGGTISANGNFTTNGLASANSIQSTTSINAGTTISAIGNITSGANVVGKTVQSTSSFAPGVACTNYGSYAIYNGGGTDPNNGNIIFCNAATHTWQAPTNITIITTDSGTQTNDYLATGTCPLEGAFGFDTADYKQFNANPNLVGLCVAGPLYFCSGNGGSWIPTSYEGQGCFGL